MVVAGGVIAVVAYLQYAAAAAHVMIYAPEPPNVYQPMRRGFWDPVSGLPGGNAAGVFAGPVVVAGGGPQSASSAPGDAVAGGANGASGASDDAWPTASAATQALVQQLTLLVDEM